MAIELHVLAGPRLLESFRLARGMHLLGCTAAADLLLSERDAASDVCRIELSANGQVVMRSVNGSELRRFDGTSGLQVELGNGDFAELSGLRLLVLDRAPRQDLRVEESASVPPTAPSRGIRAPASEPLALWIQDGRQTKIVSVDQPVLRLGRGPGNAVSFGELEVSRQHARLSFRPDGPWIEDLGSAHGTYLDGVAVTAAAWPVGAQVRLGGEGHGPILKLLALADALAEANSGEAVTPLRGASEAMRRVRSQVLRYGAIEEPVLILGETGTGKELVAQALARLRGSKRPFRPVNCGGFQETLIEAQLFGYRKGAFTGASQDHPGEFEAAADGTLFLDEIGDLPLAFQVKLLRVLESREVQRLGETHTRPVKARVLAATHRDLGAMVAAGQFREDLYHRLAVIEILLPPLRNRIEDLPALARRFLLERKGESGGKSLSDEALDKLRAHPWPGNVRELKHVVERAALESEGAEIGPEAIVFRAPAAASASIDDLPGYLESVKRDLCARALSESSGNVTGAAKAIGMSQSAFRRVLEQHGLLPAEPAETVGED